MYVQEDSTSEEDVSAVADTDTSVIDYDADPIEVNDVPDSAALNDVPEPNEVNNLPDSNEVNDATAPAACADCPATRYVYYL